MNDSLQIIITLILLLAFFAIIVFFFLEQQRVLKVIRPENRLLSPANVWLQLIPIYGMFYQFRVVTRISDSIRNELLTTNEDDVITPDPLTTDDRPTYTLGITSCILNCCTVIRIPILQTLISLGIMVFIIWYWIELVKYRRRIQLR